MVSSASSSALELEDRRRVEVGALVGVELRDGLDRDGFGERQPLRRTGEQPGHRHAVRPDVQDAAAAQRIREEPTRRIAVQSGS